MKLLLLCSGMLAFGVLTAHAQVLPDPYPEPPSNSHYYYQNLGQLIDENGNTHPEILYYTEKTFPALYLAADKISFVAYQQPDSIGAPIPDTVGRIDLSFLCGLASKPSGELSEPPCGEIQVSEPGADHLNYYLPHCPAGIENVPGYGRVVYQNAFAGIDVHFYSNPAALKAYIVIHPGADPNDILLNFEGQDSIKLLTSGSLAMYLRSWKMDFPQAIAYQIDASNNIVPLSWLPTWNHNGTGHVSVTTGTYNASQDLVLVVGGVVEKPTNIQNLEWSVYYGDNGGQTTARIYADAQNRLFHAMGEGGGVFPSQPSTTGLPQTNPAGGFDWYVSKFNASGGRLWATYYGGSNYEFPTAIKTTSSDVWVAGYTQSTNVPLGTQAGVFKQTANAGLAQTTCQDGLLASFDNGTGQLKYGTYFGGGGQAADFINDMYIDANEWLYIVGTTQGTTTFNNSCGTQTTGSFPLCPGSGSRFFQGGKASAADREGFIAQLWLKDRSLVWSTLFGGTGADDIHTINKYNGELYIGGLTYCGNVGSGTYPSPITSHTLSNFPFANPGGGAFFQNSIFNPSVPSNQFLAKFNTNFQLAWSTFFGASINGVRKIAFNPSGKMYTYSVGMRASEAAPSSSPSPNTQGRVPVYNNGTSYYEAPASQDQQAQIARFNDNLSLGWSTYLHGGFGGYSPDPQTFGSNMAIDASGRIFIASHTGPNTAPVFNLSGAYWQPQNASAGLSDANRFDNYLLAFNTAEERKWATFFGGALPTPTISSTSQDGIFDVATGGSDFLFLTGYTSCPESPYKECPTGAYCDQTYNPGQDSYISRFRTTNYPVDPDPTGIGNTTDENGMLQVYPNPSSDMVNVVFINTYSGQKSVTMTIYDATGRSLRSTSLPVKQGANQFRIDMAGYANGMYLLELGGKEQKYTTKFIKQ